MHGCRDFPATAQRCTDQSGGLRTLAGTLLLLAALTAGCQMSGARDSITSGPSRSFGWVPPQSEPPIEDSAPSSRSAGTASKSSDFDDGESRESASKGSKLAGLLPGRDKESPARKTLPVSSDRSAAVDDAEPDQE